MTRPLRVLHCPSYVGGNPGSLAAAEREAGLDSWAVSLEQIHPGYEIDEVLWPAKAGRLRREALRFRLVRRARDFDIVHFNFGSPILPRAYPPGFYNSRFGRIARAYARLVEFRDVHWLKRHGTKIVVTYQGDDARQGDWCRANLEVSAAHSAAGNEHDDALDDLRRRWIARFDRLADRIFALNPDLLRVLPPRASFLPYAHLDLDEWAPASVADDMRRPLRIVHAPSNSQVKGTRWVREAVERLRAEGAALELDLVEGPIARSAARRVYERADLAVDQLLVGWYGGLSVELMALGKPVVCYIRERDLELVPTAMRKELPVINATPETLANVLREWTTVRRPELAERGRRGRAFVERWHDRRRIARRMKEEYEALVAGS